MTRWYLVTRAVCRLYRAMKLHSLSALFLLFTAACTDGGSTPDDNTSALPAVSAMWMRFGVGDYELKLTDYANGCAIEQQGVSHKAGSQYAAFHISLPSGADLLPAGAYPVAVTGTEVEVDLKHLDGQCNTISKISPASGTFTINAAMSATTGPLNGSYSLDLPDGTTVAGSFAAAACPLPATPPPGTCVP